jgi:hypothetical protein
LWLFDFHFGGGFGERAWMLIPWPVSITSNSSAVTIREKASGWFVVAAVVVLLSNVVVAWSLL